MQSLAIPKISTPALKDTPEIEGFVRLIQQGIDAWNEAGKRLVVAIDRDPDFIKSLRKAHPEISQDMLIVFERIGRKQIYAPLLADSSVGARALLELPYAMQEKYAKAEVEVVENYRTKKISKKYISELSRDDVKKVFSGFGMRSVSDQIDFLKRQNEKFYENREPSRIDAPAIAVTPTKKTIERLGCFKLTLKGGELVIEKCTESWKTQQVKMEAVKVGLGRTAEILLYIQL